jgi:hypothetical protein
VPRAQVRTDAPDFVGLKAINSLQKKIDTLRKKDVEKQKKRLAGMFGGKKKQS